MPEDNNSATAFQRNFKPGDWVYGVGQDRKALFTASKMDCNWNVIDSYNNFFNISLIGEVREEVFKRKPEIKAILEDPEKLKEETTFLKDHDARLKIIVLFEELLQDDSFHAFLKDLQGKGLASIDASQANSLNEEYRRIAKDFFLFLTNPGILALLLKTDDLASQLCKLGMEFTVSSGRAIHFVVDAINMPEVMSKYWQVPFEWYNSPEPAFMKPVTFSEFNRALKIGEGVIFYNTQGQQLELPLQALREIQAKRMTEKHTATQSTRDFYMQKRTVYQGDPLLSQPGRVLDDVDMSHASDARVFGHRLFSANTSEGAQKNNECEVEPKEEKTHVSQP